MEVGHLDEPRVGDALALNNAAVPAVNGHDPDTWAALLAIADRTWVVVDDGVLVALLVTFAPGAGYESANYRWLEERYDDFRYVDRIVVARSHARRGLGARLYEEMADAARAAGAARLLCEVNVEPPNPQSISFHTSTGWSPIGDLTHAPGKVVRFFEKPVQL